MSQQINQSLRFEEVVKQRRSVRGFLDKPVSDSIIQKAFELARWSPSNSNIQPWNVFIASGKTRAIIRDRLVSLANSGTAPTMDFDYPETYTEVYRERQIQTAATLYREMGITRDDKAGRAKALLRNFDFFDAPHIAFLCMEKSFPATIAVDVGIYAQTLMLAFTSMGVSSCSIGAVRFYAQVPREVFGYGDNLGLLFGVAFGYEDPSIPANKTRTDRAPAAETLTHKN